MGITANAGAGALDAIKDAISLYMGLRQEKFTKERQLASDSRAGRQLALQEQSAVLDANKFQADQAENERRALQFQAERYGGSVIDEPLAAAFRRGLPGAIEAETTLPSRTIATAGTAPGAAEPGPADVIQRYTPSAETGRTRLKTPATERSQIAYYNAAARAAEGSANRENRITTTAMNVAGREKVAARTAQIQQAIAQQANALRRYGIDVADVGRMRQIAELQAWRYVDADDRTFDNFRQSLSNPLIMMQMLQSGQSASPPQPLQYNPPAPASSPGDWDIQVR